MQSLRDLLNRFRAWRQWRAVRRASVASAIALPPNLTTVRPIRRHVSAQGVRVYSLCGSCGAPLSASATLCDACARSRSLPNP